MGVISANKLQTGTKGPKTGPGWTREYQITWEAITNNGSDIGLTVLASGLLPQQYSSHPDDPAAYLIDADPQQDDDDSTYWRITYTYSTRVPAFAIGKPDGTNQANPEQPQNPLDRRPKVRISTKMFKKIRFLDLDGVPFVNKAGVPYGDTMIELPRTVINVTRNLAFFDYNLINQCVGATNEIVFIGYEAGRVKCENLSAEENFDQNVYYWKVQGEFIVANLDDIFAPPGQQPDPSSGQWWYEWRLNAGFEWLDAKGNLIPFFLAGGQKPSRPLLLRDDGTPLNGTGRYVVGGETVLYLPFRILRSALFGNLGLFD